MALQFLLLLAIFTVFMGTSVLNNGQRFYSRKPYIPLAYFGLGSILIVYLFPQVRELLLIVVVGSIVGVVAASVALYFLVKKNVSEPSVFLAKHGDKNVFTKLEYGFVVGKGAEIFFQQMCLAVLVLLLDSLGFGLVAVSCCVAVVMLLVHLPLLRSHGIRWGSVYAFASFLFGLIAPTLLLMVPNGLVYSFGVHLGGYVLGGCLIWFLKGQE